MPSFWLGRDVVADCHRISSATKHDVKEKLIISLATFASGRSTKKYEEKTRTHEQCLTATLLAYSSFVFYYISGRAQDSFQ